MLRHRLFVLLVCVVLPACSGTAAPPMGTVSPAYFPPIPPANEFDTTTERSDMRRLIVGTCPGRCRPGPLAWIQPRTSAASWSAEHRDSGEVIARLISDSAYPKFNLQDRGRGRDTVFWAVMKRGDAVISIFHSTTPGSTDLITRTDVIHHGEGFFRGLSYARWLWSDTDDLAWGTCDGGACCRSAGSIDALR